MAAMRTLGAHGDDDRRSSERAAVMLNTSTPRDGTVGIGDFPDGRNSRFPDRGSQLSPSMNSSGIK